MKFVVVAVGRRMPHWVAAGFEEYAKRMPREARVELIEVRPEPRAGGKPAAKLLAAEGERIRAALPKDAIRVVLDERGRTVATIEFARMTAGWREEGRDVAFVIGGPDGIAPEIRREADVLLALSALTLPHPLARVVLAEQLYRALSILQNHPYHRE